MNWDEARFWLELFNFAATSGVAVYLWHARRQRMTRDEVTRFEHHVAASLGQLSDRLAKVESEPKAMDELHRQSERIACIEQQLDSLPTRGEFGAIYERLNNVDGALRELRGEFVGVRRVLEMIHQNILEGSRGA